VRQASSSCKKDMADEGDVLSKLGAFLSGRHRVSLVELDALITTVSSKEGTMVYLIFDSVDIKILAKLCFSPLRSSFLGS
jgi:hypothetical protein